MSLVFSTFLLCAVIDCLWIIKYKIFALFLVYHSLHHHFLFMETTFDVLCVSATFALMLLFFMCSIYNRYQSSNSTLCCIYFLTDGLVKGIISSLLSTLIYDLNRQLSLIRCQPS